MGVLILCDETKASTQAKTTWNHSCLLAVEKQVVGLRQQFQPPTDHQTPLCHLFYSYRCIQRLLYIEFSGAVELSSFHFISIYYNYLTTILSFLPKE